MSKVSEIITKLTLKSDEYRAALKGASENLAAFGASAQSAGLGFAAAGAGIIAPLALAVNEASKLEETLNKFDVVFASNKSAMTDWCDTMADKLGRSKVQMYEFTAGIQDFFVPMGFADTAASEMSKTVSQLAIDMASFNNTSDATALQDIRSALAGSGEVMQKYGVILNETTLGQEMLNMGLNPKNATTQEKAMARLNIILNGTKAAQGDAERSAGSFANQMKKLEGTVSDAAATIGSQLIPIVTPLIGTIINVVKEVAAFAAEHQTLVSLLAGTGAVLGAVGVALLAVGLASKVMSAGMLVMAANTSVATAATTAFNGALAFVLANPVGLVLAGIAAALVIVCVAISNSIDKTNQALAKQSAASAEAAAKAASLREEGDKQRTSDLNRIDRLNELSRVEKLNASQQNEARGLMTELTVRYGELGLSIDQTTGKLVGMEEAQKNVNAQMAEQSKLELEAEIAAGQRKMKAIENEIMANDSTLNKLFSPGAYWSGGIDAKQKTLNAQLVAQLEANNANRKRLDDLEKNPDAVKSLTGQDKPVAVDKRVLGAEEREKMEKEVAKVEKDLAEDRLSAYDKEVAKLNEVHDARMKNIQALLDDKKALADSLKIAQEKAIQDAASLRVKAEDAKSSDDPKTAEKLQKEASIKEANARLIVTQHGQTDIDIQSLAEKLAQAVSEKTSDLNKAKTENDQKLQEQKDKDAEAGRDYQDKYKESQIDTTRRREEKEQDKQIEALLKTDAKTAIEQIQALVDASKQSVEAAKKEFESELKKANADGKIDDNEKRSLDRKYENYTKGESELDRLASKLETAVKSTESATSKTSGSFYASELARMSGVSNSPEAQTAAATKQLVALTKKTNSKLNDLSKTGVGGGGFLFT